MNQPTPIIPSVRTHGLITVGGVRALTGASHDEVYNRADGGDLLLTPLCWVFDFSAAWPDNTKRDLRFWRYEIEQPAKVKMLEIEWVIERILPLRRTNYPAGEVVELFALNRSTLMALRPQLAGELITGGSTYSRAGLAKFLERRWLRAIFERRALAAKKS